MPYRFDQEEQVRISRHIDQLTNEKIHLNSIIAQMKNEKSELLKIVEEFTQKSRNMANNCKILEQREEVANQYIAESHQDWKSLMTQLLQNAKQLQWMVQKQQKGTKLAEREAAGVANISKKLKQYEKFLSLNFNEYIQQHHSSYDISLFQKTNITSNLSITPISKAQNEESRLDTEVMQETVQNLPQSPGRRGEEEGFFRLDFAKLKQELSTSENIPYLCAILQALKQRVTIVSGAQARKQLLLEYAQNDFLGLKDDLSLVKRLLSQSKRTKEFLVRLVNVLSSDYYGRQYLLTNKQLIPLLIKVLFF